MVRLSNHVRKGLTAMIVRHALKTISYTYNKHPSARRAWFESLTMTAFFVILSFNIL
jgi:hypothetical protein